MKKPQLTNNNGTAHGAHRPPQRPFARSPAIVNPHAEDIHHFVELTLTKIVGDLALKLHTGRSRNEQIATDMRLFVRDAIDATLAGLIEWRKALAEKASAAGDAVMPSYTHLQRAEPVLVAHWLLAYISMLERDFSRLQDCRNAIESLPTWLRRDRRSNAGARPRDRRGSAPLRRAHG